MGIVIYSTEAETVWNAFRLGNFSLGKNDEVKLFLLAGGVACQMLDNEKFDITGQMLEFAERGGEIHACGTCLNIRGQKAGALCPSSSMQDLHDIVNECDKVLTF